MPNYLVEERTQRRIIPREAGQKPIVTYVRQYRRKEVIISILGVSLSVWSDWEDIPVVDENGDVI
jgi:hypothetical protein